MLLLAALVQPHGFPANTSPATSAVAESRATVRIERPVRVGGEEWQRVPRDKRREIVITDEQGRPVLLRLVEME